MNKKNILIVGGSSSIGNEVINKFYKNGYDVISTYSSKNSITNCAYKNFELNLKSEASIMLFIKNLHKIKIKIHTIVFLSGVLPGKSLKEYSMDEINKVFSINIIGQIFLLKKLNLLLATNSCILMMSSISAQRGSFDPIYASSKAAILGLVKSMISHLPKKSRINAIAPGLIEKSKMFDDMSQKRQNFHKEKIHSGKLLSSSDLANIIFDLCQDHWSHLNGACIDLNGGQNVR